MQPGEPYASKKILHKLHLNLYIRCCFHLYRRFLWIWAHCHHSFAICLQPTVGCRATFSNQCKMIHFAYYTLHNILYFHYLCCSWFLYPPINWHSCTWLHLAVYNFFYVISGIFCVPFLYTPLWRCSWWYCPPHDNFHSRVSSSHKLSAGATHLIRWKFSLLSHYRHCLMMEQLKRNGLGRLPAYELGLHGSNNR